MNNLFRGLLAGWGASKLGGGCLSTILVFALIWWLLGTCDDNPRAMIRPAVQNIETVVYSANPPHQATLSNAFVYKF